MGLAGPKGPPAPLAADPGLQNPFTLRSAVPFKASSASGASVSKASSFLIYRGKGRAVELALAAARPSAI